MTTEDSETAVAESMTARLLDTLAEATDLTGLLDAVCHLAVEMVPGGLCASLTVIRQGKSATVASSDERAKLLDEIQYETGIGPCLQAARTDEVVHIDDVAASRTPAHWRAAARQLGMKSVLSLPVPVGVEFAAALNVYGERGWRAAEMMKAETYATYAGCAVTVGYRLAGSHEASST